MLDHYLFSKCRERAKRNGKAWTLSWIEFASLIKMDCHYCGKEPSRQFKRNGAVLIYSGLDRKNNRKGYIQGNVVACCSRCNTSKGAKRMSDFKRGPLTGRYLLKIDRHLISKFRSAAKSQHMTLAHWIRLQCSKALPGTKVPNPEYHSNKTSKRP